jgi:predicted transcriptional regulator
VKVLLSIKPSFVKEIISGNKKFEYRRKVFKQDVDTVVIYASKPIGLIIGEFTIDKIIKESPLKMWIETSEYSGISQEHFLNYFQGKDEAYAIKIKEFHQYEEPINPYETDANFIAPQSYRYIDENQYALI